MSSLNKLWGFVVASSFIASPSEARYYDLYRADYIKGAFCSAIAGACASDKDFDNSFFQNPASLTVGGSNWDYDYDVIKGSNLEPGMKGANDVTESSFMFGAAYSTKQMGLGVSLSKQSDQISALVSLIDDQGATQLLKTSSTANTYIVNVPFAVRLTSHYHVGVALVGLFQDQTVLPSGNDTFSSTTASQSGPSLGLAFGGIWELSSHFRTGGWMRTPMTYYQSQDITTTAFANKITYHEDMALNLPFIWALGMSVDPWEDDRVILVDANFIGVTPDGNLLSYDTFSSETSVAGNKKVIAKGRSAVIEPRLGFRSSWFRGSHGTIMFGTYYENSRWEGYDGRIHATGGLAYRLPIKLGIIDGIELMAGFDIAKDFTQIFFTYRWCFLCKKRPFLSRTVRLKNECEISELMALVMA